MIRHRKSDIRVGLFETLEIRCLMAADMEIAICPLPFSLDAASYTEAENITLLPAEDTFPTQVNERISRMEAEASSHVPDFVVALQDSLGAPGFYNNVVALDNLYNQFLIDTPQTIGDSQTIDATGHADDLLDVVSVVPLDFQDTFTPKVNAQIDRVSLQSPSNLQSFIVTLQTTMAGEQANDFINNDIALEELTNQFLNPNLLPATLDLTESADAYPQVTTNSASTMQSEAVESELLSAPNVDHLRLKVNAFSN